MLKNGNEAKKIINLNSSNEYNTKLKMELNEINNKKYGE